MVTTVAPPAMPLNAKPAVGSALTWRRRRMLVSLFLAAAPVLLSAAGVHEKGLKPLVISNGQKVQLADYLVPGKTTVFDFYSEYCPTCRSIAGEIEKLHESREDIAVVLVNINRPEVKVIDWKSPVAKQYDLPSTPQLKVYGPDGKLVAEGNAAYQMVTGWFK
jgi:thiol-disulfide isomerase/thioredoxin